MRTLPGALVAILVLVAIPDLTRAQSDFDIAVSDIDVKESQNPAGELESGQPGKEYLVGCSFNRFGSGPSSIPFRLLVNGYVVQDVTVTVLSPQMPFGVATMVWMPVVAANYELACETNPTKAISEAAYTNNKQTMQFAVVDPTVATKAGPLDAAPSPEGRVSTDVMAETGSSRTPSVPRGEGGKETDDAPIFVCPECFNPQPEPPGKIVEEEEPRFHPDPSPPTPEMQPHMEKPPSQPDGGLQDGGL